MFPLCLLYAFGVQPLPYITKNFLFLFAVAFLISSCNKDTDPDALSLADANMSVRYAVDDSESRQKVFDWYNVEVNSFTTASMGTTDCTFSYGCILGDMMGTAPYIQVTFPDLFSDDCALQQESFHQLFRTGDWLYGNTHGKVQIEYYDGRQLWSTGYGPQPTGIFRINTTQAAGSLHFIGGIFSCRLYNGRGDVKKLEHGEYFLQFAR